MPLSAPLGVRFNDMAIKRATFVGHSSEILLCGRTPFMYTYDIVSGSIARVVGPTGKGLTSLELMAVSPLGSRIAIAGAGGYIHILCGRQKTFVCDIKMNSGIRSLAFMG